MQPGLFTSWKWLFTSQLLTNDVIQGWQLTKGERAATMADGVRREDHNRDIA
jgi:hypothetical protein